LLLIGDPFATAGVLVVQATLIIQDDGRMLRNGIRFNSNLVVDRVTNRSSRICPLTSLMHL